MYLVSDSFSGRTLDQEQKVQVVTGLELGVSYRQVQRLDKQKHRRDISLGGLKNIFKHQKHG